MNEHLNQKSGSNTFLIPASLFIQITKHLFLCFGTGFRFGYWGSFHLYCCLPVLIGLFVFRYDQGYPAIGI